MSQALSTLSGGTDPGTDRSRAIRERISELAKIYTSSTNQVAAKQRWSKRLSQPEFGMSMLAKLRRSRWAN
jgi:hypothetical protein